MRRKIQGAMVYFLVLTMLSIMPASAAPTADRSDDEGCRPSGCKRGFMEKLNLSDEQRKLVEQACCEHKDEMKGVKEALREKRGQLKLELDKPAADKDAIYKLVGEINDLRGRLLKEKVENIMRMKEILTPEQYKSLGCLKNDKSGRRAGKARKFGSCGKGPCW